MPRLLIVDDSPLMRKLLGTIFGAEKDFEVAFARDGIEALEQLETYKPDVITLDIQMPHMNGLMCLDGIMLRHPCPVVMVSSLTAEGAAETLEALSLGAIDFIAKPKGAVSLEIDTLAPILVETVRNAAKARLRPSRRLVDRIRLRNAGIDLTEGQQRHIKTSVPALPRKASASIDPIDLAGVILIGTSTGGPPALDAVLSRLPAELSWAVVVAQHMPASFTGQLARRLDGICAVPVTEVTSPQMLEPGHAYIAKGDADILIGVRAGRPIVLSAPTSPDHQWHPSVDRLVSSAMLHLEPQHLMGVLMTGMGNDGADAMRQLREMGGHTIAEAEETAVVWGMPGELIKAGGAAIVAPLDEIADAILDAVAAR